MIKKEYAIAAVIGFLSEDMNFTPENCSRYANLLKDAQAFTMPMQDLMTLVDESGKKCPDAEKDIRVELPFPSIYIEYTQCFNVPNMSDVNRCCLFMVGNHANLDTSGEVCPVVYMTIHYSNGTQLCTGALVQQSVDQTVIELASRVKQESFVKQVMLAMHSFTGILMDCIVNGGVREYTPSTLRKKMHSKQNKKHKILEHKVLKLDLAKLGQKQETSGGTHASPRLHLRRGHWRHFKNGEKKWIKPMWVGDKDLGVIHKDYEVSNG